PALRDKYKFNARGSDTFEPVSWEEMYRYHAKAAVAIARTYSGEEGEKRLKADGYEPEMIEACHHAGTRTMKLRGGMGLLGVMGKYGLYRWSNMLAFWIKPSARWSPRKRWAGGCGPTTPGTAIRRRDTPMFTACRRRIVTSTTCGMPSCIYSVARTWWK